MRWVQSASADFGGNPPSGRSGHTAVRVKKTLVVVFGGLVDKKFLQDLIVLDTENNVWFQPECTGSGQDGNVGPCPRAFHVAIAIDCHMFIFGGRSGRKRLGDFWMLDTDTWQWAELTGYGELPPARDFAAGTSFGDGKLVICGGWDGTKWLSDVYVLDTISLEWRLLPITGPMPPPRCGHTATMVEKRLLLFGGRGGGGPILGDLWALKGLFDEEKEPPAWTQLKLPGSAPAPRCGHTTTPGGTQLLVFGGHGTGGWLSRYDVYHNDLVILDRASVQWKRPSVHNEAPAPRAYHSVTRIGTRCLLIGGYDGKCTFNDIWWLVSDDDPMAKQRPISPPQGHTMISENASLGTTQKGKEPGKISHISDLRNCLGLPHIPTVCVQDEVDEMDDKELLNLGHTLLANNGIDGQSTLKVVRDHWLSSDSNSLQLKELDVLLRDYHRQIAVVQMEGEVDVEDIRLPTYQFHHARNANEIRIADIPVLLEEYKGLMILQMGRSTSL